VKNEIELNDEFNFRLSSELRDIVPNGDKIFTAKFRVDERYYVVSWEEGYSKDYACYSVNEVKENIEHGHWVLV
jgi:hypothetical protein